MTYILIVLFMAFHPVEFNTKEACEEAAAWVAKQHVKAVQCFPKGRHLAR